VNSFFAAMQRFGVGRLAVLLGVGGGGAALVLAIVMNLFSQPMGLLYSGLDLKEASSITQALDQAGIHNEARGDGSTIMVDRDKVATARLMLAGKGLPTSGSMGYEIFDQQNALGQTDLVQQLNMKRGAEGELARTIMALQGVTFARVHLALPDRQVFQDTNEQPTASVTIGFGAREASPDEVLAVQNLVAGAVRGMKPESVVVIDQHGKTLSAGNDGAAGGRLAADARASVEDQVAARIKNLIEGVVGPGKVRVQVSADVDMAQVTTQEEKFDPDGQVVRSEQTNETSAKDNTGSSSTGATSASTNVPGATSTASTTPGNGSENTGTESTTNYEISKTVTTQVSQPGTVKRLSVAVAIDGVTAAPGKDGKPGAYRPRTPEEMQHLTDLVKAAMGFSTDRGDQVQVVNEHFPDVEDGEGTSAAGAMNFDKNDVMRMAELGILGLVAILILFFVLRPMIRSAAAGAAAIAGGGNPLLPGGGGGAAGPVRMVAAPDGQMIAVDQSGQPLALPSPDGATGGIDMARIEGQVKASSVKRVAEFVDKHPEESVAILRSWLHESA
jgi:flagellar M-ring protein FliF